VSIYLDSGDAGPDNDDKAQVQSHSQSHRVFAFLMSCPQTLRVRNHLESLGFQLGGNLSYYLDHNGEHSEYFWGKRFHVPLAALYAPQPVAPSQN
jgi:hypothetical protein